jgi:hypothetical protein
MPQAASEIPAGRKLPATSHRPQAAALSIDANLPLPDRTVDRVVKAHSEKGIRKLLLERKVEVGPSREHAVIKRR